MARFLNPYNFVRPMQATNPDKSPLLGRCLPPPHDRYVGHTGKIVCRLTTKTPLFIADSHDTRVEEINRKKHPHYRFFRDPEGTIAIPGTSLRGAIRSIFETVTNSCFAHFDGQKRLSYRLLPRDALTLVPARVHKKNEDTWQIELLPGTAQAESIDPDEKPSELYAAWIRLYDTLKTKHDRNKIPDRRCKLSLNGWKPGDSCYAIIEKQEHTGRSRFWYWNVVALADDPSKLSKRKGQQVVQGYLCITNQNIENKHDERLFFRTDKQPTCLVLPPEVRKTYRELIQDYQERHQEDIAKRRMPAQVHDGKPAISQFIIDTDAQNLSDGDLVYAKLQRSNGKLVVQYIAPVSIPRVAYERTIGDLLEPSDRKKCSSYDDLCPACRVFGWVWGTNDPDEQKPKADVITAYAGRVRFSHAIRIQEGDTSHLDPAQPISLSILSSPKPTTTRFYLAPKKGKPRDGLEDKAVDYNNTCQKLRGRKMYRHHGDKLDLREYCQIGENSDQNCTVHDVQPPDTVFEFTVHFENMSDVELGALLWSLEMQEGKEKEGEKERWHHRIGMGKPLGFGSATIEITALDILNPKTRYESLSISGYESLSINGNDEEKDMLLSKKAAWITSFKQAMEERYCIQFDELDSVRDMRAMLEESPRRPVHYPRSSPKRDPQGENFKWFVWNRSGKEPGPRKVLALADEDTEGLPFQDESRRRG